MRRIALLLCGLWLALPSFAVPCASASLADYFALGSGGCTIGSLSFESFASAPTTSGATAVDPSTVFVTPMSGPGGHGFALDSTVLAAGAGELLQVFFNFRVVGALGGDTLTLGEPAVSGEGNVTMVENGCIDGLFAVPVAGCSTTAVAQTVFAIEGIADLEETQPLAVTSFFDVFVDLTIDGGPNGSAVLGPRLGSYLAAPAAPPGVPEPATPALLGMAALAAIAAARRRK